MSEYFGFEGSGGLGFGFGVFAGLSPDIDHVERGLANLPSQFFDSTILRAVLEIYLEEVQELEQTIYDFKRSKSLSEATGFQLDIIGEQIGRRREGLADEEYRRLLRVQVALNTSQGQTKTLLDLWRYLLNTDDVSLNEEYPAGVRLYANSAIPSREVLEAVSKVTPITVKVGFVSGVTSGSPFCFLGNTGLGFSSVESPTTGGRFVSRIDI